MKCPCAGSLARSNAPAAAPWRSPPIWPMGRRSSGSPARRSIISDASTPGSIDAGVALGRTIEDGDIAEIERAFRVSVLGAIHVLKAALPAMIEQGGGTIINIEATAHARALPVPTITNATRHAIEALNRGLRREFSQKPGDFHIIDIAPASVDASLFHQAPTTLGSQLVPAPPVCDARIVAVAIVLAAEDPRRGVIADGDSRTVDAMERTSLAITGRSLTRCEGPFRD